MIYFLQREDDPTSPVKIGWTISLDRRRKSLQTASPTPMKLIRRVEAARHMEKRFHDLFHDLRLNGEWFRFHPDLLTAFPRGAAWDMPDDTAAVAQEHWEQILCLLIAAKAAISEPLKLRYPGCDGITVGALMEGMVKPSPKEPYFYHDLLLRASGVRFIDGQLLISTNHPFIHKVLAGTPWEAGWSRALGKIPGATSSQKNQRFDRHQGKAITIPVSSIFVDENPA